MFKNRKNKSNLIFFVLFLVVFIFGVFYVWYSWFNSFKKISDQAALVAGIAATGIDGEALSKLQAIPEDADNPAFQSIKNRLESYLKLDNNLRFVYLYTSRNDKLYFMVDSEPAGSADYAAPGQEYTEADDIYKKPFSTKKTIITEPVVDRWGTWKSVLSPVIDHETGEVFAVLGMDYPVGVWNKGQISALELAVSQIVVVLLLLFVIFLVFKKVLKNEEKFRSLVSNIPGVAYRCQLDKDWTMEFISNQIFEITGFLASDFIHNSVRSFASIIYVQDRVMVEDVIKEKVAKKEAYNIEYRLEKKNGKIIWVKEKGRAVYDVHERPLYLDGVIIDISIEKETLLEVETKQRELEKLNKVMIGRELKMVELKKKLKDYENSK